MGTYIHLFANEITCLILGWEGGYQKRTQFLHIAKVSILFHHVHSKYLEDKISQNILCSTNRKWCSSNLRSIPENYPVVSNLSFDDSYRIKKYYDQNHVLPKHDPLRHWTKVLVDKYDERNEILRCVSKDSAKIPSALWSRCGYENDLGYQTNKTKWKRHKTGE